MQIKVPATSANLGSGFDCIGMSLNLYNSFEFNRLAEDNFLKIRSTGETEGELELDENNLVYKSYRETFKYLGLEPYGLDLVIKSKIPLARGLGSSASAVVAGVIIANTFLNNKLGEKEMLEIAVKIEGHPDNVAPALLGGIVISGSQEDGSLFYRKIKKPKNFYSSVIIPDYALSTEDSRRVLPKKVDMEDAIFNLSRMALLVDSFHSGEFDLLKVALEDKLHTPYREKLLPGFKEIIKEAKEDSNVAGVTLSGAGPTIIFFHKEEKVVLDKYRKILDDRDITFKIKELSITEKGWEVEEEA